MTDYHPGNDVVHAHETRESVPIRKYWREGQHTFSLISRILTAEEREALSFEMENLRVSQETRSRIGKRSDESLTGSGT